MANYFEDAEKPLADAKDRVRSAATSAAERANGALAAGKEFAGRAIDQAVDTGGTASGYIREFPLVSAFAMLGAGMIAGWLLFRNR